MDEAAIGQAPMVHRVVATVPHKVRAECKGMAAAKTVTVGHNDRAEVELRVASFSKNDLWAAQNRLTSSKRLDLMGMGGSAALFVGSAVSLGTSNKAYAAAADISGAKDAGAYESYRSQGASHRMTAIGLGVVGTGLLSATVWHKLTRTKKKSSEVKYIQSQLGER